MSIKQFPLPACVEVKVLLAPDEAFYAAALAGVTDKQLGCVTLWGTMQDNPRLRRYVTESAAVGLHSMLRHRMFHDDSDGQ